MTIIIPPHEHVFTRWNGVIEANCILCPLKLEICIACGDPTGKAGKGDDSLYLYDDGPYCRDCYDQIKGDSR